VIASTTPRPAGLVAQVWRRDHLVALLPKNDPLAACASLAFADLGARPIISLESGSSLQRVLDSLNPQGTVDVEKRLEVSTFESSMAMASAGVGVSIVPDWCVERAASTLRAVPLSDAWAAREIQVITRERASLHASTNLMLGVLFDPKICLA